MVLPKNEEDQKQRQPKTKTPKNEDDQKWRRPKPKKTKNKNYQIQRRPKNEDDQKLREKLGGKPFVHSYVVILMLLGLFPEKFRDFWSKIYIHKNPETFREISITALK